MVAAAPSARRARPSRRGRKSLSVAATDKGLYCSSPDEPMASEPASNAETRSAPRPAGPRAAAWWAAWLPRLTVRAGAAFAPGRREYQTVALASFPLDAPRTRVLLVADNDEAPSPPVPRPVDLSIPADAEADCLDVARAKAVALALVEPERGRSYVERARHAAWLPEIRLRMDRRLGRSESLDQPSTSTAITSPLGVDTIDDVRYEARVTWDLARLIFNSDELAAQAQTIHMAEIRRDIEVTLSRLYFERRRLGLERLPIGSGERSQLLRRELRVRENRIRTGRTIRRCLLAMHGRPDVRARRPMTEDLRRHPRISVDVQANVRTTDGRKLPARTRDLSRSGMCLITTSSLAQRDELLIDLILLFGPSSASEPLPLRARVVWCTPISQAFQVGAMFEKLSTTEQSFLDMFLRYLDGSILPAGAEAESVDESSEAEPEQVEPAPEIKDDPFRR